MADICLPILKFSHATDLRSDKTIPWVHLTASDIFVIVQGQDTQVADGLLSLRVVQANKELEALDIGRFVDRAIEARRHFEQAGTAPQIEQLPIFGMTKDALLALRWRRDNGQERRIQLRMRNPTECRQVVTVFQRRGMEFRVQRPGTARPDTGRPATESSQSRPQTSQNTSPYFEPGRAAFRPSPFQVPSVEAGSLSQMRSPSSSNRVEATPYDMPPPRIFTRDETSAPRDAAPTRPTTAQIYRSVTTPSQQSQYESSDLAGDQDYRTYEQRPSSTSHTTNLEAVRDAVVERGASPMSASGALQVNLPPRDTNDSHSSRTHDFANRGLSSSGVDAGTVAARTSTSLTSPFADTLEHEIPPRRELPFKRPESRSASDKSTSRPATPALELPPLQKPTLAREGHSSPLKPGNPSPLKDASQSRPRTVSPLKRSFETSRDEPAHQSLTDAANKSSSASHSPTKPPSTAADITSTDHQPKKQSRMDELLARKKPLSERSTNTNVSRLDSLADAPHEIISPPGTAVQPPEKLQSDNPATYQADAMADNDFTVRANAAVQNSEDGSLREYAAQTREDRIATLDEFMVANLHNRDFTTLCEDLDSCWRRIALGL